MSDPSDYADVAQGIQQEENQTGNPAAQNPGSSASGNGQFINSTWLPLVRQARPDLANVPDQTILQLRNDPSWSSWGVQQYAAQNAEALTRAGIPATPTNLALAHGVGADGATRILSAAPGTPVSALGFGQDVIAANQQLRGTAGDAVGYYGQKMAGVDNQRAQSSRAFLLGLPPPVGSASQTSQTTSISGAQQAPGSASAASPPPPSGNIPTMTITPQGTASQGAQPALGPGKQFLLGLSAPPDTEALQSTQSPPDNGGMARNIAAGMTDAGANVLNTVANPSGTLGNMLAAPLVATHDYLAPMFGGKPFDTDTRNMLLGDNVPQPGTRIVNSIGQAIGANPADVTANTPVEALARRVTGAAGTAALLGPSLPAGAVVGAGGALAGEVAGRYVSPQYAPLAEEAGNIVGGAAAGAVGAGVAGGVGALKVAVNRFANGENPLMFAPKTTTNPLSTEEAPPTAAAGVAGPSPGIVAPSSAGAAAATPEEASMTPEQVQAYRSTAEGQKLLEPQQPGVRDATAYVPGVAPNAAEIEQQVNTARDLKALNMTAPDVSQAAKEIAAENNNTRAQYLADTVGSKVDLMNAEAAQQAQATQDLTNAWRDKAPVDATPVVGFIDQTLAGPEGKIAPVRDALMAARQALYDNAGNLETDPEMLYGARKQVSFLLSKKNLAANPAYGDASVVSALRDVQQQLDGVIEGGSPGYKQYLQNYSNAARGIDEMSTLQDLEPKLYDTQNRLTYNSVQRAMRQIVTARMAPGINPYRSISDATMQRLWNLRDDLRRSASAQELARSPGSDTAQNAWDIGRQFVANKASRGMAHMVAAHVAPGVGNVAVELGGQMIKGMRDQRAANAARARGMELLHPNTPLRNPLHPD